LSLCSSCTDTNDCNDPTSCVDCNVCVSNCTSYTEPGICVECDDGYSLLPDGKC